MKVLAWCLMFGLCAVSSALSQTTSKASKLQLIRIWGVGVRGESPLLPVLTLLESGYQLQHPEVRFEHHLYGDDSALGGLYSGAADLALMDREPSYIELDGYQQVWTREKPVVRMILFGSGRKAGHSSPLVIIVNRKNPLRQLTLAQIDAIFNSKPSLSSDVEQSSFLHWNDVGLKGFWNGKLIHPYGFNTQSTESQDLIAKASGGIARWLCRYVAEGSSGGGKSAGTMVSKRLSRDLDGVGFTTLDAVSAAVRVVPIVSTRGLPELPTERSLQDEEYPLRREVLALFRDTSGEKNEEIRHFVEYLSSVQAESIIHAEGSYLFPAAQRASTTRMVKP